MQISGESETTKNKNNLLNINRLISDRDRIRTCDRLLRRQMLYPAELRDLVLWSEAACPPYPENSGGGGSYATLCCGAKLPVRRRDTTE